MHELLKNQYTMEVMQPGITWIYDGVNDSIYVDESETEAFVVDSGMLDQSLVEYIRENVTKKPLKLVLTHGHLDHSMRAGEFDEFYMSAKDDYMIPEKAGVDLSKRIDLHDGDVIAIDGLDLIAVDSAGHTPGSFSFIDRVHHCVYTGDAFSSGANVWMQLPGCSDLSAYRDTILKAIDTMKAAGVDDTWTFYGGHYEQKYAFPDKRYDPNEPGLLLMSQMAELCEKLLSGEMKGEDGPEMFSRGSKALSATYEKASMLYTEAQLK